jgi:hypothetical protein
MARITKKKLKLDHATNLERRTRGSGSPLWLRVANKVNYALHLTFD